MNQLKFILLLSLLVACQSKKSTEKDLVYIPVSVQVVNYNPFSEILSRVVADGKINFELIKKEESAVLQVVDGFGLVNPKSLNKDQRLAYALNSYHAALLWLSVSKYPHIDSMLDIASCWDIDFIKWGKKDISLSQLKKIVIELSGDPTLAVLNLSLNAKSGPGMISKAYVPAQVMVQMDDRARKVINRDLKVHDKQLTRSGFFALYPEEFGEGREFIKRIQRWKKTVSYLAVYTKEFDWKLNKQ